MTLVTVFSHYSPQFILYETYKWGQLARMLHYIKKLFIDIVRYEENEVLRIRTQNF
jgi:hypothetical protein